MKKVIFAWLFGTMLLLWGCSVPQTDETAASSTSDSSAVQTETSAEKTTAQDPPATETEGNTDAAGKYMFSSGINTENDCYFTLEYEQGQIKKISFFVPSDGEMTRAWHFGFSERSDFLFVHRIDRKTGGSQMMYVYETMDEKEQDGRFYHVFRAATARIGFLPNYTPLVWSENPASAEVVFNEDNKERMLAFVELSYRNFADVANDHFRFDYEAYQYDILYAYVNGEEHIMETDVRALPEIPFSILSEYGADEVW